MNTNISLNSDSGRWIKSPSRGGSSSFTRRLSHSLGRMLRLDWNNSEYTLFDHF